MLRLVWHGENPAVLPKQLSLWAAVGKLRRLDKRPREKVKVSGCRVAVVLRAESLTRLPDSLVSEVGATAGGQAEQAGLESMTCRGSWWTCQAFRLVVKGELVCIFQAYFLHTSLKETDLIRSLGQGSDPIVSQLFMRLYYLPLCIVSDANWLASWQKSRRSFMNVALRTGSECSPDVFIIIREAAQLFQESQQLELINRMFYNSRS